MKIEKLQPVKNKRTPINKTEVVIEWDSYPKDSIIISDNPELIIEWVKLIREYRRRLDKEWNNYCNVEIDMIMKVVNELNLHLIIEGNIYDTWRDHTDYDFMDTPTQATVYIWDELGVKYTTKITEG